MHIICLMLLMMNMAKMEDYKMPTDSQAQDNPHWLRHALLAKDNYPVKYNTKLCCCFGASLNKASRGHQLFQIRDEEFLSPAGSFPATACFSLLQRAFSVSSKCFRVLDFYRVRSIACCPPHLRSRDQ